MTTFLVFSITARKEITLQEYEIVDEVDGEDVDILETLRSNITPPYNGKCIVVNKDDARYFRLRCDVVEVSR